MNIKIENHLYNLRQFVDRATRWPIDIYMKKTPNSPFGVDNYNVINARNYYEDFCDQLSIEFDKPENGKGFGIRLKKEFLIGIKQYGEFYKTNEIEITNLHGQSNGYTLMLEIMKSTEKEILLYYPNKEPGLFSNKFSHIFAHNGFELFEYLLSNHVTKDRGRYEDISFYYRKLNDDNYIHCNITTFINWFNKNYEEDIGKIKTLEKVISRDRETHYSTSIHWLKQQNQ